MTEFGQNSGLNQICHDTIVFSTTIVSEVVFRIEFCFWFHCEEKARDLGMVAADAQQEAIGSDMCHLKKKTRCKTADTLHCDKRFLKIAFAHQFQIKGNAGRVDQSICDPKKLTQKMQPAS